MNMDASQTLAVQDGGRISHADQLIQSSEVSDDHSSEVGAMLVVHGSEDVPPFHAKDSQTVPEFVEQEESNLLPDPIDSLIGPEEVLKEDSLPDDDGDRICEFCYRDNPCDLHEPYDQYDHCPHPCPYQYQWMHGNRLRNLHHRCRYRECYQRTPEFEPPRRFIQSPAEPTGVGAGLANLGLTCFINAVLQCFTHSIPLIRSLRSWNHTIPCNRATDGFCMLCILLEHVECSLAQSGQTISPYGFVDNLNKICSYFQRGQQEDAHEFHQAMLDKLERCSLDSNSGDINSVSKKNIVDHVFGGRLVSKLRCCNCGHCSYTYETMIDLSLEIEHVDNLSAALESFTNVEKMEDPDCKFKCDNCQEEVSVEKQLLMEQEPTVAALHLKRFKSEGLEVNKIDKHVSFPLELDLRPFTSSSANDEVDLRYQLYAIVVHHGLAPTWGHYFSFVRTSPGIWHKFDDEKVIKVEEELVLSQEAYILFYAKASTPWFSSLMDGQNAESNPSVGTSPKSVLDKVDTPCGSFPTSIPKVDSKVDHCIEIPASKEEGNIDDDAGNVCQIKNSISCTGFNVSNPEDGVNELDIIHSLKSPSEETDTLQNNEPSGPSKAVTMRKPPRHRQKRWISRGHLRSEACQSSMRRVSKARGVQFWPSILGFRSPLSKKTKVKRSGKPGSDR